MNSEIQDNDKFDNDYFNIFLNKFFNNITAIIQLNFVQC